MGDVQVLCLRYMGDFQVLCLRYMGDFIIWFLLFDPFSWRVKLTTGDITLLECETFNVELEIQDFENYFY